jgi:hypothetical protein
VTTAAVLWRRIDEPGHDACRVGPTDDGWLVQGTAVFLHDGTPARLDYGVTCDRAWHTRAATVNGWIGSEPVSHAIERTEDGRWLLDGSPVPGLDGCVDVDFGFTPATNLPQLRRLALEIGQAAEYSVAWLDVPPGNLTRLAQRYERRTAGSYAYDSPSFGYHEVLEVDTAGFIRHYPGLWVAE